MNDFVMVGKIKPTFYFIGRMAAIFICIVNFAVFYYFGIYTPGDEMSAPRICNANPYGVTGARCSMMVVYGASMS